MCNSKSNSGQTTTLPPIAQIDGRAVLQPAGNRVQDAPRPIKKSLQKSLSLPYSFNNSTSNEIHTDPTEQRLLAPVLPKPVGSTKTKKLSHHVPVSIDVAGSIAAAQRVQTAIVQAQRKMRIAHYGRTKSMVERKPASVADATIYETTSSQNEKRCSFITAYSGYIHNSKKKYCSFVLTCVIICFLELYCLLLVLHFDILNDILSLVCRSYLCSIP
jgi:DNA-3-methyladenine glycosylase I